MTSLSSAANLAGAARNATFAASVQVQTQSGTAAYGTPATQANTSGLPSVFLNPAVAMLVPAVNSAQNASTDTVLDISFSETISGTDPQPIDAVLVLLCGDVGKTESAGPGELAGYTRMTRAQMPEGMVDEIEAAGGSVDENGQIHGPDGLLAAIYTDDQGNVVVVYAGTNDAQDVQTDAWQSQGVVPEDGQYAFAMDLAIITERTFPGDVVFTGHSLGGGLAATSALTTGATAVTFNAAGVHENTIEMASGKRREAFDEDLSSEYLKELAGTGQIRSYYVEGEGLTWLQESGDDYLWVAGHIMRRVPWPWTKAIGTVLVITMPLPDAPGSSIGMEDPDGGNPYDKHMMDSVLAAAGATIPVLVEETRTAEGTLQITVADPSATSIYRYGHGDPATVASLIGSDDEVPVGSSVTTVEFEGSPEGEFAAEIFRLTGKVPEGQEGVVKSSVVEKVVAEDGTSLTIIRVFDGNGQEVLPERQYVFTTVVRDEGDIMMLREMGYEGELVVGQAVTISYTEEEMSALSADAGIADQNTDVATPLSAIAGHEDKSGNIGFAMSMATVADGQNSFVGLLHLIANWVDGDPDPGTVKDMFD